MQRSMGITGCQLHSQHGLGPRGFLWVWIMLKKINMCKALHLFPPVRAEVLGRHCSQLYSNTGKQPARRWFPVSVLERGHTPPRHCAPLQLFCSREPARPPAGPCRANTAVPKVHSTRVHVAEPQHWDWRRWRTQAGRPAYSWLCPTRSLLTGKSPDGCSGPWRRCRGSVGPLPSLACVFLTTPHSSPGRGGARSQMFQVHPPPVPLGGSRHH